MPDRPTGLSEGERARVARWWDAANFGYTFDQLGRREKQLVGYGFLAAVSPVSVEGEDERKAFAEALVKAHAERDAAKASREQMAVERDEAKRQALGHYHDLNGKQARALREAADRLGVKQGAMRLGDVAMAVALAASPSSPTGEDER